LCVNAARCQLTFFLTAHVPPDKTPPPFVHFP